ncbi:MAG: helix-turn-helix domain-containing protein [Clostridia bacterium]|nr:helix-turn-helix domain-containing protein [Clostridia bacterium]
MHNNIKQIFSNYTTDIIISKRIGEGEWWLDENGKNWWNRKTHFHFNAIYLTKQGEFDLWINGTKHHIPAGHVVMIPEGSDLQYYFDGNGTLDKYYTHFHLVIGTQNICELFHFPLVFKPKNEDAIEQLLCKLIELRADPDDPLKQIAQSATLLSLVFEVLAQAGAIRNERSEKIPLEIRAIAEYIDDHLNETLSIDMLAERSGYSTAYFTKKFKAVFGRTPTDYIAEKRIYRAKDELRNTDRTIYGIANSLGFSDASYFSSFFKARTGLSPAFYRKAKVLNE